MKTLPTLALALLSVPALAADDKPSVRLITLDPGHFHAALVQKFSYPQVDNTVHVFAPAGSDLDQHLARIQGFNTRTNDPTAWKEEVYTGSDFLEKMLKDKPGNVLVLSGNNAQKTDYILKSVQAGLNVLSDKPMAINPANFATLKQAFAEAEKQGVLLYDIMTERSEITTMLQKEISQAPALFGELEKGTPEKPAVEKVSVHHFFKEVAGKPLIRPAWFFDVRQQGEGLVDVTTHLVDLVQWEVFPNVTLSPSDAKVLSARRWATAVTPAEFERSTGAKEFPAYLKRDVDDKGVLQVFSNGEMIYTLRGVHAKVSVTWNFEPPAGTKDTHYSIMRGTKANAVIRQGPEQKYKPMLYIEKVGDASDAEFEATLKSTVDGWQKEFPGVAFVRDGAAWRFEIPAVYDVGHEAHFAQVTRRYLDYLKAGKLPAWEVPNMITKYATIMQAYELSRPK